MAEFCIATGLSPTEYRKLTLIEYKYMVEAINERNAVE